MSTRTSWGLILMTAIVPVLWGSTYVVTRQWLPADMPLTGAAIRALPSGLLLLAITRKLPQGQWWWRSTVLSFITMGLFFVLVYVSGARLPSGVAATLMASSPLVMVVLGRLLLKEQAPVMAYVGAVVGILGVALLAGSAIATLDVIGVLSALVAVLISSLGYVLAKKWKPPVSSLTFASWQLTIAGLMLTPTALIVEGPPPALDLPAILGFAYLGLICTGLAYVLWFRGLAGLPARTVGILGLLNPLAGTLLGALVAGEVLTPVQALGGLTILAGVGLGLLTPPRRGLLLGRTRRHTPPVPAATPAPAPHSRAGRGRAGRSLSTDDGGPNR
ncbi:EamA family transporter [Micrococcus luteus]